ncbi:hypothetical protein HYC85_024233 [Camellia sinensis]|uniref:Uncharacterized protein n=1 Tax=Camellia sinensis TaxID=4442 RepID=A0A7J7G7W8_CAMSI|nr:hypothetical protein HYC85_024233 [Camellia sinensis]
MTKIRFEVRSKLEELKKKDTTTSKDKRLGKALFAKMSQKTTVVIIQKKVCMDSER